MAPARPRGRRAARRARRPAPAPVLDRARLRALEPAARRTTYVTTDIAAVPLLWVLPLAIYLLSFIIAFGRWPAGAPPRGARRDHPAPRPPRDVPDGLATTSQRIWVTVLWHFVLLFVVALACHGELALGRPSPRHLTEFYLLISVGGVLGGMFNALSRPLVFNSLLEYPLAMVLACVLVAGGRGDAGPVGAPGCWPWSLPLGVIAASRSCSTRRASRLRIDFAFLPACSTPAPTSSTTGSTRSSRSLNKVLTYGMPLLACALLRRRPLALGAGPGRACSSWRASSTRATTSRSARRGASSACFGSRATATTGLHGAAPRHHAARPAEPDPEAARRAALLLPPRRARSDSSSPSWTAAAALRGWR